MVGMRLVLAVLLTGALAGCTSTADAPATASAAATAAVVTATPGSTVAAASPAAPSPASAGRPAFMSAVFTDVRDGAEFRLSDFSGKTVLVIGMAVW